MTDREKLEAVKAEIERRKHALKQRNNPREQAVYYELDDLLSFIAPLLEDDKCRDCNNVKGCITCENGDQYCHITEC